MTYAANLATLSRTPLLHVRLKLDSCTRTFGTAPCLATGEPCYNTFCTCVYPSAFVAGTKNYDYTSADVRVAPGAVPGRPYIKGVTFLSTEITDNVTLSGRIKIELYDEPCEDIGADPYIASRTTPAAGTYFRRLLARNPNYKGRMVEIREGFAGDAFCELQLRANEPLDLVTVNKNVVTLQTIDLLKGLGEITVPPKVDLKLLTAMTAASVEVMLAETADFSKVPSTGYLLIDDEIIEYSAVDAGQRRLTVATRGANGTTAAEHSESTAVTLCRYFAPANPFDIMLEILTVDAGLTTDQVDVDAFEAARDWPGLEIPATAFLTEPVKVSELLIGRKENTTLTAASGAADSYGLADLLDCKVWVGEDLKITIRRNIANAPGRTYRALSDANNVIVNSTSVDMHEVSRINVCVLYWDKSALGKIDDQAAYGRRDIAVNGPAVDEYGDQVVERIFCRWLKNNLVSEEEQAAYISDMLLRRLLHRQDAAPVITLSTELKDSDIKTGDFATLATDELCNPDGMPLNTRFQIIRRENKGKAIDLKVQRMPLRRCAFYADTAANTYAAATAAQQEYGGFYTDPDTGKMTNGDAGFYYY